MPFASHLTHQEGGTEKSDFTLEKLAALDSQIRIQESALHAVLGRVGGRNSNLIKNSLGRS